MQIRNTVILRQEISWKYEKIYTNKIKNKENISTMSKNQLSFKTIFPKSGLPYRKQVVNPRH